VHEQQKIQKLLFRQQPQLFVVGWSMPVMNGATAIVLSPIFDRSQKLFDDISVWFSMPSRMVPELTARGA
jgi:hypothetical protein